jgi:glutaredoxin 3
MLTLYVKTGCPFCAMVLHKLDELAVPFEERNIADDGVIDELVARGGKQQVPYLVDAECNVEMYESADIVEYLDKRFGGTTTASAEEPKVCPVE